MFYFVNKYLLSSNSSAEHAEIKRLKLFKRNKVAAKLVTFDYDNIIHATLKRFGLDDSQLVNLYDFFAGTTDYQGKDLRIPELGLAKDYQVGTGNSSREVKDGDRLVAKVFFIGGTIGQVDHVDYYDQAGNITLRKRFDIRGFNSVDQTFGKDGEIYYERYYRPNGELYLEKYYVQSTQNTPINSLNVLKNYKGMDRYLNGPDYLENFFLNELAQADGQPGVFIADRPDATLSRVAAIQNPAAKKYFSLPFNHLLPGQDPVRGKMSALIEDAIVNHHDDWDGVIVDTQAQKTDLEKRFGQRIKVFAINASPAAHVLKRVPMNARVKHQLIYVGRLAEDKGISTLISLFAKVHKKVSDSTLILYGYGTPADTKQYHDQVEKLKLKDAVAFAGYQPRVEEHYDNAQLFVDCGMIDAQPLAMTEALEHGVPVIAFNYSYGPAEVIKNGVNGELVAMNDKNKMVKTIVNLLNKPDELQKLSDGAYDNLDAVDYQATWKQWGKLIND
ncbi:accessory Sec system glycosyltransferase Asp1 [Limosilactobacillus oris]|uniref:accessory Sec system glycosyltransferase Asp1 n=1 Tax=Limosilactobacillus oris TaxID=1632 RepID=UPI0024B3B6B5|nr:accessory Sec system glycosyltransferase Asp1 [Limosilactobacillus oris]WHO85869.1 accessory Sec system glycosyltransferase Asp1 [Limosilactobacillus oris]